jgi:hypothetical protein
VRPQRVLTCESCAFYGVIFSRCYADGTASWHPSTESRCTEAIEPSPIERRRLGPAPRPPSAAEYAFGLDDASSVGGMPMWLVDPHHPACPECGKAMTFFAQLDLGSLPQPEEGIAYAVYCSQCHVAGTFIQQT